MVSLAARIFRFYLVWIRRSQTQFLTARNMREHIKAQYIHPQSFSPPQTLGSDITIERVDVNDWPLIPTEGNKIFLIMFFVMSLRHFQKIRYGFCVWPVSLRDSLNLLYTPKH